jgi:hypothetical protein
VPTINLTDDELAAVTATVRRAIEDDRFPHAPRLDPLRAAVAKFAAAVAPEPLPEVLAVDREKARGEFMRSYPGDNRKTKGEAWRRYERNAVSRGSSARVSSAATRRKLSSGSSTKRPDHKAGHNAQTTAELSGHRPQRPIVAVWPVWPP